MSFRIDDKDEVIFEQQPVAKQQPGIQNEDQKTQEVAKPVIAALNEETPTPEALPPVTTIDTAPVAPAEEVANPVVTPSSEETTTPEALPPVTTIDTTPVAPAEEVANPVVTPSSEETTTPEVLPPVTTIDTAPVASAEETVKVKEKTVEKVTTVAEKQGVQTPDASAKDTRIALRVHRNGHPEKHGGRLYSLKSDTGHHYLNRYSDGRWFHTDSKGHKQEVLNFNEKFRIVDEHHVQLANAKKV